MLKVEVFVYDKVFGSSAIPKATTLLIQDGGVKGHHGATYGVQKILNDLENIEVHLGDEDKAILLLCALPRSFESFKDTMLYGKEGTVILEEVQAALRTKELTKSKDLKTDENGQGLSVSRGNGGDRGNRGKSGNKSKFKCFNCNKMGHF